MIAQHRPDIQMLGAVDVLAAIDLGKGNVARDSGLTSWLGYALPCLQVIPRGLLVSCVFFLHLVLQCLPTAVTDACIFTLSKLVFCLFLQNL